MFETTQDDAIRSVRDGQLAPVTCAACGCRLEVDDSGERAGWFHFGRLGGRDATGHRIACVDASHDVAGRATLAA